MNALSPEAALGVETIPPDEAAQIEEIVEILRSVQEHHDRRRQPVPRTVHSKQHGCVRAEFVVEPNLPPALRHGIFRDARAYEAIVRFSNARRWDDRFADAHGMAIKLLGVEGPKLLEYERNAKTQDLVLIDHPVFFAKNVADLLPLMRDFRRLTIGGMTDKARTAIKALLSPDYRFRLLRRTVAKWAESPLAIQYWSTTPLKLGDNAMKVSLRPRPDLPPVATEKSEDKLRLAMAAHLRDREARFDVLVQLQVDPAATPIEDASKEWREGVSPQLKVATLRIPRQTFTSAAQMRFGENLSFTPWHALSDHRPLGGINRVRKRVYEAMSARRHELNDAPKGEPSLEEVRTLWPVEG